MQRSYTNRDFLPLIVILVIIGWGGVLLLMNGTQPTIGPRWLFYVLLVCAITGSALPFVVYLNQRFPTEPLASSQTLVREALFLGVYTAILVWMKFGQVVNFGLAVIFLIGFALLEAFLRLRESSFWRRP
jgi:Flp pilus assembly protein protease CpaA